MTSNQMIQALSLRKSSKSGQTNRSVTTALENLYLDYETADVHFIFGADKKVRIPAHKALMAANSETFRAMFYGDHHTDVPNVSIDAFKEFLRFFYYDKVELSMDHIAEVLNLGKTFTFSSCLSECERYLMDSLSIENVCMSYELGIRFDLNDLCGKCEKMISEKTEAIFQSYDFKTCQRLVLTHILKLDLLSYSESMVFRSCMNWVSVASEQEKVTKPLLDEHFGNLLYNIRFRSIKIEEFTTLLSQYGDLFSSDEYQEIVQLIVSKDCQPKLFHAKPRLKVDKEISIECSCVRDECKLTAFYFQDIELIQFTVSRSIVLCEIVCSQINISNKEKRLPAEMTIIEKARNENETQRIVCHQKVTLKSEALPIIALENPLLITSDALYEIQFKQCPASSQFYCKPFKNEVQLPETDIVVKFQTNTKTREKVSLICGLNFKLIQ